MVAAALGPPTSLSATSQALLQQPTPQFSPFGPAGITDAMRQGWGVGLGGLANQFGAAQQFQNQYGQFANQAGQYTGGVMGQSPYMGGAPGGPYAGSYGGIGAGPRMGAGLIGQGTGALSTAMDPTRFNQAMDMTQGAFTQTTPGLYSAVQQGQAAMAPAIGAATTGMGVTQGALGAALPAIQNVMGSVPGVLDPSMQGLERAAGLSEGAADVIRGVTDQYSGRGNEFDPSIAAAVGQVGASFDPYRNPALSAAVSQANQALGRDFRQSVMPTLNRGLVASGPGAYGGTRAGVAQGMREQSLANAMAKQTADMLSSGYEAGLNRYVQDRANTLQASQRAAELGADVGIRGAGQLADVYRTVGDIYGRMGQFGLGGLETQAGLASQLGRLGMAGGGQLADIGMGVGQLGLQGAGQMADIYSNIGAQNLAQAGQLGELAGGLGRLGLGAGQSLLGAGTSALGTEASERASMRGAQTAANALQAQQERFALGSLMPTMLQGQLNASLLPGQLQQQMGGLLGNIGLTQQQAAQNQIDYLNNLANVTTTYPQTAFDQWVNRMQPILAQTGQMTTGPAPNPFASFLGGASTGYGLYDAWNQRQNAAG